MSVPRGRPGQDSAPDNKPRGWFPALVPRRCLKRELLDLPPDEQDSRALQGSLMDIRRVNLWLGGVGSALKELALALGRMEAAIPVPSPGGRGESDEKEARRLKILDVAAGSADITAAMAGYAEDKGYAVFSVAADLNLAALSAGRAWNREPAARLQPVDRPQGNSEISYVLADGLRLPFPDGSFDIVHCSLVLHHLSRGDAVKFMAEMARVSKFAIIIGDLRRNIIPWALIWLLTRLFTANRYTRCDGPLSVLKAFTPSEMRRLAEDAGIEDFRMRRRRFWRMSLLFFRDKEK